MSDQKALENRLKAFVVTETNVDQLMKLGSSGAAIFITPVAAGSDGACSQFFLRELVRVQSVELSVMRGRTTLCLRGEKGCIQIDYYKWFTLCVLVDKTL